MKPTTTASSVILNTLHWNVCL